MFTSAAYLIIENQNPLQFQVAHTILLITLENLSLLSYKPVQITLVCSVTLLNRIWLICGNC